VHAMQARPPAAGGLRGPVCFVAQDARLVQRDPGRHPARGDQQRERQRRASACGSRRGCADAPPGAARARVMRPPGQHTSACHHACRFAQEQQMGSRGGRVPRSHGLLRAGYCLGRPDTGRRGARPWWLRRWARGTRAGGEAHGGVKTAGRPSAGGACRRARRRRRRRRRRLKRVHACGRSAARNPVGNGREGRPTTAGASWRPLAFARQPLSGGNDNHLAPERQRRL